MNKSYFGKSRGKSRGMTQWQREQGEHENQSESRPTWQQCRDGEHNAEMESAMYEVRLERWVGARFVRTSQAIYASELQQYREVSESIAFQARGPGFRSCSASS